MRRRSNLLRHRDAPPPPAPWWLGHNGGPLLTEDDLAALGWRTHCWTVAHRRAWRTPPREIALRRLERAEALGMSYRAYALEIMERGRFL